MGNFITVDRKTLTESVSSENCNIYRSLRHKTNDQDLGFLGIPRYEGIPQNLVINLCAWVVLNLLFIVLRKKAWNYGRMAVMQKEELKWTDMFYGDDASIGSGGSSPPHVGSRMNSRNSGNMVAVNDAAPSTDVVPLDSNPETESDSGVRQSAAAVSSQKANNISEIKDSGYFSWIKIVFTLTDQQYRDKCGPDCVSYLSFQRHLIVLAVIITCCSLIIILPINMHANQTMMTNTHDKEGVKGFTKTTINNLRDRPDMETRYVNFLWAHVILSIGFLFVSIYIMRHFSRNLQFLEEDSTDVSHTIIIIGINRTYCEEGMLRAHLMETYPGTEILEVSFAYSISKLQTLEFKRLTASSAKLYFLKAFEDEKEKHGEVEKRPTLRPYHCGVLGCCFTSKWCGKCQCKNTDALEYYTQLEEKFAAEVDEERKKSLNNPLGIAFVTFYSTETAERIVEDYACSARLLLHTPESRYTRELRSNQWMVKFAPVPEDIYWENLTLDFKMWYFKFFIINLLLLVLVVICTTPVYIFTQLVSPKAQTEMENDSKKADQQMPLFISAIIDTLPTAVVWVLGVILISLVYQSDMLIGFWTKTAGNMSEMLKVFFFLNFMVIVLPAMGLTSLSYFFSEKGLSWSCIFYSDNGALFVNYVITSALTGTAAELMRIPELFMYGLKLCFARSAAEVGAIRKSALWDFQIGSNYAWMMLHFAIFTCFSVIFPLVTPFGLLYLVLKHFVDRYNIYFAYAPCKVEKQVHATAVNFVIMSMFMLQINLLAYVHFHIGQIDEIARKAKDLEKQNWDLRYLQIFSLLGFSVTAALFLGQVCFNVCADFSPIHHFKNLITDEDEVLEVGRASAVQPLTEAKRRSMGSKDSDGHHHYQPKEKAVRVAFQGHTSTIQIGGDTRVVPVENQETPSKTTEETRRSSEQSETERQSLVNSSNYNGSGRAYGRYIPPLLRPEFIRILMASRAQQREEQQETQSQNTSQPSKSEFDVVSEKKAQKKDK